MKQYKYKEKFYKLRVVYTGYFVAFIFLFSLYSYYGSRNALWLMVALVCAYQFYNTFVSLSNPEEVELSDKVLYFKGFGKIHKYFINEIKDLRIKEFRGSKKIYLRVNKDDFSLLKGRYWVDCLYFEKGDELFEALLKLEDKIRPHTMKAYARNQASSSQQKENKKK